MSTRLERETTITYNEEEQTAQVWTCSPVTMRKLDKLCEELPDKYRCVMVDAAANARRYEMPKKLVKFAKPVERVMTDEQKAAASERMKAMQAARKAKEANK